MGTMSFTLPEGLASETARALERSCVVGGPDSMPWPTRVEVSSDRMTVLRDVDESGNLMASWDANGTGRIMTTTGTLMERNDAYDLVLELARGKVNQLRSQAADWQMGGLVMTPELEERIRATSRLFGRAAIREHGDGPVSNAQRALNSAFKDSESLVQLYVEQMFQARHQRQPRLDSYLGSRIGPAALAQMQVDPFIQAVNCVSLPFHWKEVEVEEGNYKWEPYDVLLDWAERQGLSVAAGPLISLSKALLPDWIWIWEKDLASLSSFFCEYIEAVIRRYRGRIRSCQLCTATNYSNLLGLGEDELLWLTVRMAEAARQVDPNLSLIVGISQPWGEYMAVEDRTHSPFIFADTLIRSGMNLAALDLEVIMGVSPQGTYCRDLLELSRLIDLYTLLGTPLRVTLGYPSSSGPDANAPADAAVDNGSWRGTFTPEVQAEWASKYAALALCKPSVRAVHWVHLSDAVPHFFPHCGLFDAEGQPKPLLAKLRDLRENHLR